MDRTLINIDTEGLKKYLSNRYPYLCIDKAIEIVPGATARGYKNITANEWFFPVHYPSEPMMPGMIQMEALLQMLSLTVLTLEGYEGSNVYGVAADKIRLKKRVMPGCRMDIEAELLSWNEGIGFGIAKGMIDEEEVCLGEFTFKVLKSKK